MVDFFTVSFQQSSTMNVFKKEYNNYHLLLTFLGVWPFQKSILTSIRRIIICTSFIVALGIQVTDIIHSFCIQYNILFKIHFFMHFTFLNKIVLI